MNTATFSERNSFEYFGLVLSQREIGEAEPRTNYIDVPARDGVLDLTEAFGEVKYKNRKHVLTFQYIGTDANWQATVGAVNNYIHGKTHKIYLERDYYWVGRCFVKAAQSKRGIREIEIECDCEPYKYRLEDTVIEVAANGLERAVTNSRKTVTPRITVLSGAPTLKWTDRKTGATFQTALTSAFDGKILDFKFYEGVNAFIVSGTGSVKLTYREGSL